MTGTAWWRGAVVYQIYPLSFADSNGDGLGDLAGITARLDHVAGLGVDAIWLSPFYPSPLADFGYDVADYRDVDPRFGTLDDFRRLLDAAHGRGLRVLIDFVPSHTSDRHPWFAESRADRDNARADWYVWADPRIDGTPPNNWLSVFGGPAWTWDPRRRQYYFHNFLPGQPGLNHRNPAVTEAIIDAARFWLDLGVDGFRLDAIANCACDGALRDNPVLEAPLDPGDTVDLSNPFAMQRHLYSQTRPEAVGVCERFRALTDAYPGTTTVGEVATDESIATAAEYMAGGRRLHMAYTFNLLTGPLEAARIRRVVERMEAGLDGGWPCWSFSNHDVERVASRWGGPGAPAAAATMFTALLLSLRGTVCLYQGEELGLGQAEVPFERLRDPAGRAFWPEYRGRDGCRTPMPWSAEGAFSGFSTAEPWLPPDARHRALAVDRQDADPDSVLAHTRRLLAWRKRHPALVGGAIRFLDAPDPVLAFERRGDGEALTCAFNLGPAPATFAVPSNRTLARLDDHGVFASALDDGTLRLPGWGAFFGTADG